MSFMPTTLRGCCRWAWPELQSGLNLTDIRAAPCGSHSGIKQFAILLFSSSNECIIKER